jgi:hypothetical protein
MKTGTKRVVQGKRVNWRMNAHGALKAFTKDRNKTAGMFFVFQCPMGIVGA